MGQPQARPEKPCPLRGSLTLTRAAWTPVFPGAPSPAVAGVGKAPRTPRGPPQGAAIGSWCLDVGVVFSLPGLPLGGLSCVRAVLLWRERKVKIPWTPPPEKGAAPQSRKLPPVTEVQVTGERQQTEEELTQEPDQAGRVLATPPPGGPPPASPGPVPWAECLPGPSSGLRKRPTSRGQSPAHSETSAPPGTAGPCRPHRQAPRQTWGCGWKYQKAARAAGEADFEVG